MLAHERGLTASPRARYTLEVAESGADDIGAAGAYMARSVTP